MGGSLDDSGVPIEQGSQEVPSKKGERKGQDAAGKADGLGHIHGPQSPLRIPGPHILRHKSRQRLFFNLDDLTEEPDGQILVEEVVQTKERDQILHFCMDELNPDYRESLYLTYFEGMSYLQAAEVMGKSVKQITNMVYRGKERLRGLLEREGITNVEP